MNKLIILENIDKLKNKNNYNIYIIFGKDIYLNNLLKNNIINILIKNNKYNILNKIIYYDEEFEYFINRIYNKNLFFNKNIFLLYIDKNILINTKKKIFTNDNNKLIIICNNYINNNELKIINSKFFEKKKLLINCQINNFINFLKILKLKYLNLFLKNLNIVKYYWIYSIYNNNISIVYKILKNVKNKKILLKNILYDKSINNINIFSFIYCILLKNFKLSIVNLLIIKFESINNINNVLYILNEFILLIFYIKYNIYKIEEIYKINIFGNFYYKKIINFSYKIKNKNMFKIINIIKNIEVDILNNNISNDIIWKKLEIILFIFCT